MEILNNNFINPAVFNNFTYKTQNNENVNKQANQKSSKTSKININIPVIASTAVGTLIPVLLISKHQNKGSSYTEAFKKMLNIEYELKEMLLVSLGSIAGGLAGGIISDKGKDANSKLKEGLFSYSNIVIPACCVAGLLSLSKRYKKLDTKFYKIAATLTGILGGMPVAAMFSNKVNETVFNSKDKRKIELRDYFVHVDDLIGAAVLAKIPLLNKIHAEKVLPLIYAYCGYETGTEK